MLITKAIPGVLRKVAVFTQKWGMESIPLEKLLWKSWGWKLWALGCQGISVQIREGEREHLIFCPQNTLAIAKDFEGGNYCTVFIMNPRVVSVFLEWALLNRESPWNSDYSTLCHFLITHFGFHRRLETCKETKATEMSSIHYSKYRTNPTLRMVIMPG